MGQAGPGGAAAWGGLGWGVWYVSERSTVPAGQGGGLVAVQLVRKAQVRGPVGWGGGVMGGGWLADAWLVQWSNTLLALRGAGRTRWAGPGWVGGGWCVQWVVGDG